MIFIKSVFLSFTTWVLAALLNGLLAGTWLYVFSNEFKFWPEAFFTVLIFTLIFSIPGIFIFLVILMINRDEELLFRYLLKAGFIISALSSLILFIQPFYDFGGQRFFLALCIIIASVASIMMHHSRINNISINEINKDHV